MQYKYCSFSLPGLLVLVFVTMDFGAPDAILFALVIVSTAGAGLFQGWFEAYTQDEPHRLGLALPKGKGPFWDFLYLLVLTCSVPLILGKLQSLDPNECQVA